MSLSIHSNVKTQLITYFEKYKLSSYYMFVFMQVSYFATYSFSRIDSLTPKIDILQWEDVWEDVNNPLKLIQDRPSDMNETNSKMA